MFHRFTDQGRMVMSLANQEAQQLNHEFIGTEHILLGLVKEGTGVGARALKNLSADLEELRTEVEKMDKAGPDEPSMGRLPPTTRAKQVIEWAIEESRALNHKYIGTEHILLGLLRATEGAGAQILLNKGLKLEGVRKEVLRLISR